MSTVLQKKRKKRRILGEERRRDELFQTQQIKREQEIFLKQILEHVNEGKVGVIDLSIFLIDKEEFMIYCEFLSQIGINTLVISTFFYEEILTSSIKKLKEIFHSLRLWKEDLPTPEKLFVDLKEKINILHEKRFQVLSARSYINKFVKLEIFRENIKRIKEKISTEFKEKYKFATEFISNLLTLAGMKGIEIITKGEALIEILRRAFQKNLKNLLALTKTVALAKTSLKVFIVLILDVQISDIDPTLVDLIINFFQGIQYVPRYIHLPLLNLPISPEILDLSAEVLRRSATVLVLCP